MPSFVDKYFLKYAWFRKWRANSARKTANAKVMKDDTEVESYEPSKEVTARIPDRNKLTGKRVLLRPIPTTDKELWDTLLAEKQITDINTISNEQFAKVMMEFEGLKRHFNEHNGL